MTDGARTRDLRSHNPTTSVATGCRALQNRLIYAESFAQGCPPFLGVALSVVSKVVSGGDGLRIDRTCKPDPRVGYSRLARCARRMRTGFPQPASSRSPASAARTTRALYVILTPQAAYYSIEAAAEEARTKAAQNVVSWSEEGRPP